MSSVLIMSRLLNLRRVIIKVKAFKGIRIAKRAVTITIWIVLIRPQRNCSIPAKKMLIKMFENATA